MRHARENLMIFSGWYSMIGITGEFASPSTRQPIRARPSRKRFELSRSCVILRVPRSPADASSPMMILNAESACARDGRGER